MTRINSAIQPSNLTDQHLIAELRELPRIFTAVNKRIEQCKGFDDIPEKFALGTGHVKFFYDKLKFLFHRHIKLRLEYSRRFDKEWVLKLDLGMIERWKDLALYAQYTSTPEEHKLLIDRISTRIKESNQIPRYYGNKITKEQAIELLIWGVIFPVENPIIKELQETLIIPQQLTEK